MLVRLLRRVGRAAPLLALLWTAACQDGAAEAESEEEPGGAASASASTEAARGEGFVLPPARPFDENPLDLPGVPVEVEPGARVFAVPRRVLESAKLGTTLALHAARVEGREGDSVIVRVGHDIPHTVHPAYLVVPQKGRIGRGTLLVVAYGGVMHHAVAKNLSAGRVVVRITDAGRKLHDKKIDSEDVGVLPAGELAPGGFAFAPRDGVERHLLLVSRGRHPDGKVRWLAMERAGAATLVEEEALVPLPPARFEPRAGDQVRVAHAGALVPAEVRAVDRPGLFTVKRERAGAPLVVGPGMLAPPAKR